VAQEERRAPAESAAYSAADFLAQVSQHALQIAAIPPISGGIAVLGARPSLAQCGQRRQD
jgi:hypothetical protein